MTLCLLQYDLFKFGRTKWPNRKLVAKIVDQSEQFCTRDGRFSQKLPWYTTQYDLFKFGRLIFVSRTFAWITKWLIWHALRNVFRGHMARGKAHDKYKRTAVILMCEAKIPVRQISAETGVCKSTIYMWRDAFSKDRKIPEVKKRECESPYKVTLANIR